MVQLTDLGSLGMWQMNLCVMRSLENGLFSKSLIKQRRMKSLNAFDQTDGFWTVGAHSLQQQNKKKMHEKSINLFTIIRKKMLKITRKLHVT